MNILIKQARVVDPQSPFNGQSADIFIENGTITRIGNQLPVSAEREIRGENLHISPGWVDLFANFADPGYEFKETLESGAAAAAAGGYTDVLVIPNTKPCLHSKSGIEYIAQKSKSLPVNIHPIGAVSVNTEGKELAEMYDMHAHGALAFGDGIYCIQSAGLLLKALQYVKAVGGFIIQLPDDKSIHPHGLMNEGIVSTRLGLPGKPAIAEELIVARDIKLARYTGSRLHFTGISTKKSLEYISRAKAAGIDVTCSVTPYHLFFNDEDLAGYDSNLKVNPPLRTKEERDALRLAVAEGNIDCLASHHLPHEYDSKVLEFEYAKYGMTGLETAFAVLNTAVPGLSPAKIVEMMALNPRRLTGLAPASIREGNEASLTLFDPYEKWVVREDQMHSRARNTPFTGKELTGRPLGIINRGNIIIR